MLVCSNRCVFAQEEGVHGGEAIENMGDPSPYNPPFCANHLRPPIFGVTSENPPPNPMGWLENTASPPNLHSWTAEFPSWTRDRRPVMTIQLSSADWSLNPCENADWWWIAHYETTNPQDPHISEDIAEDNYSPNPDYTENRDLLPGPNGVPDQFDVLIRHFHRWATFGVRRFIMHLPAGVYGGRLVGYGDSYVVGHHGDSQYVIHHDGDPAYAIYGGTNQSMAQYSGLPQWKREYFRGDLVDLGHGQGPKNAWAEFIAQYAATNPGNLSDDVNFFDKYSIEVYVGGGVGLSTGTLGTQTTADWGAGTPPVGTRLNSFYGTDEDELPLHKNVWRKWYGGSNEPHPIDPRYNGQLNMRLVWRELHPWFDQCGVKTVWLDAASENVSSNARRWGALELAHNLYLTSNHIRIAGETVPTITTLGMQEIYDDCAIANMPWFGNYEVVSKPDNVHANGRTWKDYALSPLSRTASEVHLLDNLDLMGWDEWREARTRGFVVGAYNAYNNYDSVTQQEIKFAQQAELLKRWYSLGKIRIADFNGDNVVDGTDYTLAHAAISSGTNNVLTWPIVFGNGDIDNNGQINNADAQYFDDFYLQLNGHTQQEVVDFDVPAHRNLRKDRF